MQTTPAIERAAQAIYEQPDFGMHFPGKKPAWVPGGNSDAQEVARDYARRALGTVHSPLQPSIDKTLKHIARVGELLAQVAAEFVRRAGVHDRSKFSPEELLPLAEMDERITREGNVPFGSKEYDERKKILGDMIAHHHAHNSHHCEHYPNGIGGMDLFDVMEMFVDWKAASERGEQPSMNLAIACEKYGLSPQLEQIMRNTAERLGWKADADEAVSS